MDEQLRDTLDRAAPTVAAAPDFEQVWHRGRRRRRTRHLSTAVATVVLVVAAGWTTQQMATPGSVEVVGQPDTRATAPDPPSAEPPASAGNGSRTARQWLEEWHEATGQPIVVPTQPPDGYHMVFANHYVPTSPESSLPPVAACIEPAGTTDNTCTPTKDPSPRTSFHVDGYTVRLEVMDGSGNRTILDEFTQLDWTSQWRQVDWIDTAFEPS